MQLIWKESGDWLDITPTNPELVLYWVNELDQHQVNNFNLVTTGVDLSILTSLKEHVFEVSDFLVAKLKITSLERFKDADFVSQAVLNDLHRSWVGLIRDYPKLVLLIRAQGEDMYTHWNQINKKVHAIEESFVSLYRARQYWEVPNTFGSNVLSFDRCQLSLVFSQEGRSTYNKWLMFDYNAVDRDTNDFLYFGSEVLISLNRPLQSEPPKNYIDYCNQKNIPIVGSNLNIGNFTSFEERLDEIRHVYIRNVSRENNTALFKI